DATGSAASCDFLVTVAPPPIPVYTTSYPYNIFAGLNFIANQLDRGGNTLREIIPVAPDGATVLKFDNTNGTWVKLSRYNATLKAWVPPTVTLAPGEGALLQSPNSFSLTFTGTPRSPVLPN